MKKDKLKYVKPELEIIFVQAEDGVANGSVTRYINPEMDGEIDVIPWEEKESGDKNDLWFY